MHLSCYMIVGLRILGNGCSVFIAEKDLRFTLGDKKYIAGLSEDGRGT